MRRAARHPPGRPLAEAIVPNLRRHPSTPHRDAPPRLPAASSSEPPDPEAASLRAIWRRTWEAPDPALSHAGAAGELLVAKVRALLAVFILYLPLSYSLARPHDVTSRVAIALVGAALLQTLIVYRVLRGQRRRQWLSFGSSLLDVTLVSAALVTPLLLDGGGTEPGARSAFLIYFLAVFATSLRYDSRVCAVTGAAAVLQYAAIAGYAATLGGLERSSGATGWMAAVEETGRLTLLAAATVLAAAIVVRSRELRRLSTRDPLTGVLTRGFFHERLAAEAVRLEHARESTACVMLDIDHFKRFNDTHGHLIGDEALRLLGAILRASFRASDIVARYGGEEFAAVVPGLAPAMAVDRMEAIRREVAATPVPLAEGGSAALTVSVGVACFPSEEGSILDTLRLADRRLYEAKAAGRGRVIGPPVPRPQGVPAAS
jgi:diguanylate cyclase (GGDEF)-like protein